MWNTQLVQIWTRMFIRILKPEPSVPWRLIQQERKHYSPFLFCFLSLGLSFSDTCNCYPRDSAVCDLMFLMFWFNFDMFQMQNFDLNFHENCQVVKKGPEKVRRIELWKMRELKLLILAELSVQGKRRKISDMKMYKMLSKKKSEDRSSAACSPFNRVMDTDLCSLFDNWQVFRDPSITLLNVVNIFMVT